MVPFGTNYCKLFIIRALVVRQPFNMEAALGSERPFALFFIRVHPCHPWLN